jgi:dihydrofolate reductase
MPKVFVTNIISLDGYYEGPGGNVMALPMDEAFDAYNLERMRAASAVLLGSRSYEMFSSYWPGVADAPEDPGNRALDATNRELSRIYNGIEKVVVSDTCVPSASNPWRGTTTVVPRAGVHDWLDAHPDGEAVVYGSRTMWNGLLQGGHVDELHLMVGALALGDGTKVFADAVPGLELLGTRTFTGSANVVLRYAPARDRSTPTAPSPVRPVTNDDTTDSQRSES